MWWAQNFHCINCMHVWRRRTDDKIIHAINNSKWFSFLNRRTVSIVLALEWRECAMRACIAMVDAIGHKQQTQHDCNLIWFHVNRLTIADHLRAIASLTQVRVCEMKRQPKDNAGNGMSALALHIVRSATYYGQRCARMNRCEKQRKRLIWILSPSFLLFLHFTRCYCAFRFILWRISCFSFVNFLLRIVCLSNRRIPYIFNFWLRLMWHQHRCGWLISECHWLCHAFSWIVWCNTSIPPFIHHFNIVLFFEKTYKLN